SSNEFFNIDIIDKKDKGKFPVLVLKKLLDHEENPQLQLLLTATDGGKPEYTGSVTLLIHVLDVNDNPPTFDRPVYEVKMYENSANQTLVIQLNASDADEGINKEVMYSFSSLVPPMTRRKFLVNERTGEIKINDVIDFEDRNNYEIHVDATDKGNPPMIGHCTVLVEILDENDNLPEVVVTSLALPVKEDAKVGTVIALISVSDQDSGANGQVTCALASQVPFKLVSTFKNHYSLVLESALDRESVSNYQVVVTARDGGSPPLWATSSVSVEVSDVNDNAPAFAQPEYTVFVKENNAPGCHIFTVSARDADAQENARVSYSLVERRVGERLLSSYVSVHAESGKVFALQPLDHEELELLRFQVSARDAGVPPLGSNVTLQVFVLDDNDNAPALLPTGAGAGVLHLEVIVDRPLQVFYVEVEVKDINDNPPVFQATHKNIFISETQNLDSHLALDGASDADVGANALLTYRLSPNEYFSLEVPTNDEQVKPLELVLRKQLDREVASKLLLVLRAIDGGKPELTGTVELHITVLDVNDNAPVFDKAVQRVKLLENARNGTLVIRLNASDLDDGSNSHILYSFATDVSTNTKASFRIDSDSGEIKVNGKIDFEETKLWKIPVQAVDEGNPPMYGHCTILIEVLDVNDNAPELQVTSLSGSVPEDAILGTVIALISATDRDAGGNGQVTCSLTPHVPFKLVSNFKNRYSLVLDSTLDRESVSSYQLVVTARDGGSPPLWATASVSVEVSDGYAFILIESLFLSIQNEA
nr:unnamed protein product [Sorex araneus]